MDRELEERVAAAAARGLATLRNGGTLDDVLRAFREDDRLGTIPSLMALMKLGGIGLRAARNLVESAGPGERFSHLRLDELRHIAGIAELPGLPIEASWLRSHLEDAIIDGRPWKLFVRDTPRSVRYYEAATPDPARAGSMHGDALSFDAVRGHVRAALSEPAWCDEVRIVRDEPDLLLVHFPRVREAISASTGHLPPSD